MAVRLEGMNELLQRINQMGRSLDREVKEKALKEGAELLKEQAKMNVPVRTGNLKEHIIVSNIEHDTVHVGPDQQGNAFYGHFLEFGTSKMEARPFLGPTFENNKRAVEEKMKDVIKRELNLS